MESSFPPVQAGGSEALMPLSATAALAYPEGSDQGGGQERAGDRDQQDPAGWFATVTKLSRAVFADERTR